MAQDNFGFVRVAAAVPKLRLADCKYNVQEIKQQIDEAVVQGVQVICFPELSITGYTCADLFFLQQLQSNALSALEDVCEYTRGKSLIVIVGAPLKVDNNLYNCAFVMTDGGVSGVVPKINLPNTGEFYEKRWFTSGRTNLPMIELWCGEVPFGADLLFMTRNYCFGIELCEDLWSPLPPSTQLAIQGAEIIFNLSSSNCIVGKHAFRRQMITQQSCRVHCGYVYTSSGIGESTTDVVFSGSTYIAENGEMLIEGERFLCDSSMVISEIDVERLRTDRQRNTNFTDDKRGQYRKIYVAPLEEEDYRIEPIHRSFRQHPFLPDAANTNDYCEDVLRIQSSALGQRWQHTHAQTLIVGVSGGLDSTLALLVCTLTAERLGYNPKQIIGVTMPGFGTTGRTYDNAVRLMERLGVSMHEIPIRNAVMQHFEDIEHNPDNHDITYENAQARERTQILMDLANKYNGLVVGTGDLSELALGWATYNADQMSMYAVNAGIPKTLVRCLVEYVATERRDEIGYILDDILDTPVSPELLPADSEGNIAQKTEDKVGPYELHDFFIYYFLRFGFSREKIAYMARLAFEDIYTAEEIQHWLDVFMHRFFMQQYKRSCMPDAPKVVSVSLSPRGDWRMPSDAHEF
ncbi:MAG: NAD(+) synthase [Paludibacter sp.]|nr:NAD(+) synthase [Bacteroidales bacterium]MCM1068866.1 NAD(+) synthase [Prevotella sp.]MCM1353127.1 NAD(+) synthase [Bacteroides sp.]MCM1442449.1 NAD(+) synthase [Muribaculum sp.]MCM1481292.1 NAD(+) synthase [Paludibacter sp.]